MVLTVSYHSSVFIMIGLYKFYFIILSNIRSLINNYNMCNMYEFS